MSSIPGRLMGKPSPKGEQSTLTLTLAMLFFLISKQMGKQSNSLFIALMKLLFRLLIDYLGGSAVSYFLKIWGISSFTLLFAELSLTDCIIGSSLDKAISKSTTWRLPQCRVITTVSKPSWNCCRLPGHEWRKLFTRFFFTKGDSKMPKWLQAKGKRDVPEDIWEVFVRHFQRYHYILFHLMCVCVCLWERER